MLTPFVMPLSIANCALATLPMYTPPFLMNF
jgi:hypothetical protein